MEDTPEVNRNDRSQAKIDPLSSPDVHQFNHAQYMAYGLILIIFGFAEYAQDWESLKYFFKPSQEPNTFVFILRSILIIELIFLNVRWIIATINELDMWSNSALDWSHWKNNPFSKQNVYTALFGLSLLLGLLLAIVNRILILSSILSIYFLFNYWTQWLCNNHFRRALKHTITIDYVQIKKLSIMKKYWLGQPQLARLTIMMFFSLVSVCLATASSFKSSQKIFFEICAYAVLILDILFSEIFISIWRTKRDRELEKLSRHLQNNNK